MPDYVHPPDFDQSKWYVLFVRSNQEKKVADRLCHRAVEFFLPCYSSLRRWKDRRVQLTIPLFPGYVFVRLPFLERLKVLTVPNVVALVGTKNAPSVVAEDEIAWIRKGIEHGAATPHEYLQAGQRVIIEEGAMTGMKGILVRRQNKARVVVALESISRSFAVEIDAGCVRPLDPRSPWSLPAPYKSLLDYSRQVVASKDPLAVRGIEPSSPRMTEMN